MAWWQVMTLLTLLIVLAGDVTLGQEETWIETQQEPDVLSQIHNIWPDSEAYKLQIEEWFGNPAKKAAEGIPKLLLDLDADKDINFEDLVLGTYLPSTDPDVVNNSQCISDVDGLVQVMFNPAIIGALSALGQDWPLRIPDSWGKLPDGYLYSLFLPPWGMMEECTNTRVDSTIGFVKPPIDLHFRGRYCLVTISPSSGNSTFLRGSDNEQPQTRVGYGVGPRIRKLRYGTCIPDSCTPNDLQLSIEHAVGDESSVDCHTKHEKQELYAGDIVFIVFLSILLGLIFFAGVVDILINYFDMQQFRKSPLRYLLIWSFYTNMGKMFHINSKEAPEVISCLHGIRVLSMTWVVWGHSYMYQSWTSYNLIGVSQLMNDVVEQPIVGAYYAVDTFFFISGLLLVYGIMKEFERVKRINWIIFFVHRFIRLIPPILVTAGAMATIARLVMVGPLAESTDRTIVQTCRERWWADSLFLSNIISYPCLGQCWYTAVDTQLYILSPLVLLPLLYRPKIGKIWLGAVTVISMVVPMMVVGIYPTRPNLMLVRPDYDHTRIHTYDNSWIRATPYAVGMWGGLLFHHFRGKKLSMNVWQALIGWLVAVGLGLTVIFSMADYNKTGLDQERIPLGVSIFYEGFYRGMWGLALLWLVFACHKGYGGPINTILAHPCWQPLSRLTFTLYLVSMSVQVIYPGVIYVPLYVNHINMFVQTCGSLFVSGLLAIPLSLMTEGPILGLEKLLFARPGRGEEQAKRTTAT